MMQKSGKVVVVSQHYPPDPSTTAAIMAAIADHVAQEAEVLVLSGTPGSASLRRRQACRSSKSGTGCRARPHCSGARWPNCCSRSAMFVALLMKLRRGDVALTVTAPFMLPYAVAAAAKLKGARSVLIMHDLYPDVLVMAGLLKPHRLWRRRCAALNALMFRALDAVVIIGRDTEKLLLRYRGMTRDKIRFIPNWATLAPRRSRRSSLTIPIAVRFPPASSSACPAISALPTIPSSCSRRRDCCATIRIFISCCRAGGSASSSCKRDAVRGQASECHAGRPRRGRKSRSVSFGRGRLAHSLSQERRRRIGAEPVLQSACGRPSGHPGFRTRRRGGADGDRTRSRLGGRTRQTRTSLRRRSVVLPAPKDPQRAERAAAIAGRFDFDAAMAGYCSLIRELVAEQAGLARRWLPAREAVHQERRRDAADDEKQDRDRRRGSWSSRSPAPQARH